MQLMTGKSVILPAITKGNMAAESQFEDEGVSNIMERHSEVMKNWERIWKRHLM